jgi:uncharacterized membrane protein
MKRTTAVLSALAGAALIEAALIPGVLIGAAAVLAPTLLPKYFAGSRRRRTHPLRATPPVVAPATAPGKFGVKRAIFKTITFRVIATSLDFSSNYVIIGDIAASAALSAYGFVAGPLFFLGHEMLWHRFGSSAKAIDVPVPMRLPRGKAPPLASRSKFTINRPLAKTITYRTIVTTTDFTANFLVVGDLATAAGLTAFGFVVGPFVYYFHEKAWDRFSPPATRG